MILLIRLLFIFGCAVFGYLTEMPWMQYLHLPQAPWIGAAVGLSLGTLVISLDIFFKQYTVRNILSVLIGVALGLLIHWFFMVVMS